MKDRHDIWHPITDENVEKVYGTFWTTKDGLLFFRKATSSDDDPLVRIVGMPKVDELWKMVEEGIDFILDRQTSRRFMKAFRTIRNNHGRTVRDKARMKETQRRMKLKQNRRPVEVF